MKINDWKKNINRFERKLKRLQQEFSEEKITREKVVESFEGWLAHIYHANTFKYRKHLVRIFNRLFPLGKPIQKHNLTKHYNFLKKSEDSEIKFSVQKTLLLFKKSKIVEDIAKERNIKVNTVWCHLANLIEYNQLSVWRVIPYEKVKVILSSINTENDLLKSIKQRVNNDLITYNEINCILAYVKSKNRIKNVFYHVNWYKKVHCLRKCYFNKKQRDICSEKFAQFVSFNPNLNIKRKDFINLFNNHLTVCVLPEREKKTYLFWKQFQMIKHSVVKRKEGTLPFLKIPATFWI